MGLWDFVTTGEWDPPPPPPPSKLLTNPWNPANPFQEDRSSFRERVIAPTLYGERRKYNILIVGQVGAGKSSYVNSLLTVTDRDETRICDVAEVREAAHSTTFQLRKYPLGDRIDVYDMPGYDQEATDIQVNMDLYKKIFDGRVPDKHNLRRDAEFTVEDPARKIDAVIVVFDTTKMMSNATATLVIPVYKSLVEACILRHIRYTVVLAKVDRMCEEADKDIRKVYRSKAIARVAQSLHEKLGLNEKYIIPIRNYVDEDRRNSMMDKLLLHSLNLPVQLAEDRARYN